jgi:hypothetical protein
MMYNQKLVASIKANGKVLREFKDTVYIPFGSEYSFLIKNLNTVRAVVNVFIDGENVVPGGLVIDPGRTVDLERWIKNGNLSEGNRFKFIERTQAIEDGPRGIKLEDGLVRIEYQFEVPRPVIDRMRDQFYAKNIGNIYPQGGFYGATPTSYNVNGTLRSVDWGKNGATVQAQASAAIDQYCADNGIKTTSEIHDGLATMDSFQNDVGITVPGSKSTQTFQHTTVGILESTIHNIVLKLVGDLGNNKPVQKAVTVKAKPKCVTCGHQNKATAKFCTECGTALEIFA